jgi:hypothetical protein
MTFKPYNRVQVEETLEALAEGDSNDSEIETMRDIILDLCDLLDTAATDKTALDKINYMLSEPDWGVGMLEDICAIVRRTGRTEVPGASWDRH